MLSMNRTVFCSFVLLLSLVSAVQAADEEKLDTSRGDKLFAEYFGLETAKLSNACLADIRTKEDWEANRETYRRQLRDMLGLEPLPERTDLKPVITGTLEQDDFVVENLHFQSLPGLYVTANLYRPRDTSQPLPAVLYVCGHGRVAKDGVSFGNKTHYQHHGAWLARNGYVCLVIDTLQLGEIEGDHHGTYKLGQWWWINRGYTPAGVEAWNCMRALDYLQSRKEVDGTRLGVTGRSGGGAYSWWIAALDERIKCAVPVAGITDLQNHVVDGCVEGHCDCMYMVNTYQWDYAQVAALVSPRPLLIANTDTDPIFPLDGVVRIFDDVRRVYRLQNAGPVCGLNITAGQHVDTQELQVHALRWLDQHLKGEKSRPIETAAKKYFEPEQLKVFAELPADQRNTTIQESFVPNAPPPEVPQDKASWEKQRDAWLSQLQARTFRAWPSADETPPLDLKQIRTTEKGGIELSTYEFASQEPFRLSVYVAQRAGLKKPDLVVLNVLDDQGWKDFLGTYRTMYTGPIDDVRSIEPDEESLTQTKKMFASFPWAMAYVAPRGVGPTAFNQSEKKQIQNRRRFYLLGQTLDGMQVWDVRRAMQAVREASSLKETPLWLQGERSMASITLYASLFEPPVKRLDLHGLPADHRHGPILLNVDRVWTMPAAVAAAAERSQVVLYGGDEPAWKYPRDVAAKLGWREKQLQLRKTTND
jgi:dienelactone hydrolase